jgi:uncharacterized protein
LLLIAPAEHHVRIEVGYGLEGTLTDALSSAIIQQIMIPAFKANQPEKAVMDGTQAIISLLEGKAVEMPKPKFYSTSTSGDPVLAFGSILVFLVVIIFLCIRYPQFRVWLIYILLSGGGRGGRGGGSGGGGFSGGGGSFGGGGSSGRW